MTPARNGTGQRSTKTATKTTFVQRLTQLVTGGESALEAEHRRDYAAAKEALQRQLKAGTMTAAEVAKQLALLGTGHVDAEPHA